MKKYVMQLDKRLEQIMGENAPPLPIEIKQLLVRVLPYLVVVAVVAGIWSLMSIFGLGMVMSGVWWMMGRRPIWYWFWWVVLAGQVYLEIKAFKPLKERKILGWRLMYYVTLTQLVINIVQFSVSGLLGVAVGWYFLYQIKGMYKK